MLSLIRWWCQIRWLFRRYFRIRSWYSVWDSYLYIWPQDGWMGLAQSAGKGLSLFWTIEIGMKKMFLSVDWAKQFLSCVPWTLSCVHSTMLVTFSDFYMGRRNQCSKLRLFHRIPIVELHPYSSLKFNRKIQHNVHVRVEWSIARRPTANLQRA
jgi:hypothetical protein